jgi:UDPglucose 6-dehydrogenase
MTQGKVGIVGCGVVGRSLHQLFGNEAVTLDVEVTPEDRTAINACEAVFVCVPTPPAADLACDTSIVEECVRWIESPLIVIRSTVAPGTTDRLRRETGKTILFQPEYLGETVQHPMADVKGRSFIILGGPVDEASRVADIYQRYYHSELRFYFTSAITAEVAKYMENSFYAVKVMFCNEFYDIARTFGVEYQELREIWLADPRISRDHTFVYPENRGFSGKCLPKDVSAMIKSATDKGYVPRLLETVMRLNAEHRANAPAYAPFRCERRA